MYSTCNNCRALSTDNHVTHCKLGFEIDKIVNLDVTVEFFPLELCPKPLTFDKYFTYLQTIENKAKNIT